jgi:hypothetical protein
MGDHIKKLDAFFTDYEKRFNESLQKEVDVENTVKSFAGCFIEASPRGVICGKNNDEFRKQIPKGYEFYKSIGTQSMSIRSKNTTQLDELHCMTKVDWSAFYRKMNGEKVQIDFSVIYFTQMQQGEVKIFGYVTGDEEKVLKERGLIE